MCCNCCWIIPSLATVWNSHRWYYRDCCTSQRIDWCNMFSLLWRSLFLKYLYFNSNTHLLHLFCCQVAVGQSTSSDVVLRPPLPQVVELSGSESPSVMNWNSRNQRARQDISRARLRAIENSLKNGQMWAPPSPAHRKTWEEEVTLLSSSVAFWYSVLTKEAYHLLPQLLSVLLISWIKSNFIISAWQAQIERVLHDHFLFRKLTDSQCQVLLDCMQKVEVQAGDVVVKQVYLCNRA